MASSSSSALSPNKPSFPNPELLGMKWKNKYCSHQPRLSGNETQLPNHDSAADQVTVENSPIKTKDLKVYIRVTNLKNSNHYKVVEKAKDDENPKTSDDVDAAVAAALAAKETEGAPKSWNLRPRPKPVSNSNGDASALNKGAPAPVQPLKKHNKIPELQGRPRLPRGCQSKKPKPKLEFSVTLTKEEIEEDILKLTGKKPARRPKRRAKTLQKQLDNLTPASLLDGMSAETYRAD